MEIKVRCLWEQAKKADISFEGLGLGIIIEYSFSRKKGLYLYLPDKVNMAEETIDRIREALLCEMGERYARAFQKS